MAKLTIAEQTRIARLAVERARRSTIARMLGSPLLRWRYGAPVADDVLIVPQDLRTADPSFAGEIAQGHFGLAGRAAYLETGSPFDLRPPSPEWARELHGFSWLRHLRAAATPQSTRTALSLVAEWIKHSRSRTGPAWEASVVARRLISWIANAGLLLEGIDQAAFDRTADSLADQLIHLSAVWRDAPEGYPRLMALIGLTYGDLCIAGHERHLAEVEALLSAELQRQILPDGGHISRNASVLVDVMLDLLPLRQCFANRQRKTPTAVDQAIARAIPMLRYMRLGDGSLARFNGTGAPSIESLATVLAYDGAPTHRQDFASHSNYVRMERGDTVLIADVGPPPPLELAGQAHAGCLSLEVSIGAAAVFVNCGAPGPADQERRAASRSTAAHNTLCLGNKSSSKLIRHPLLERLVGAAPIRFPDKVGTKQGQGADGDLLDASHDGYVRVFGLLHRRRLALSADGAKLVGSDMLGPARGTLRLPQDIPFTISFHLHPKVACTATADGSAFVTLRTGEVWRFSASGAELSIEPSTHIADLAGSARSLQIVLRGATFGESEVRWRFEKQ